MTALTLDEIAAVLSNTKTRGEYKPVISRFNDSGDLAVDLSEKFPGKVAASLRNSINVNIEKNFPNASLKTVLVGEKGSEHVLLINMTVYAAQQAEAAEEDGSENEQ